MYFNLTVQNDGFSAPITQRTLKLVLSQGDTTVTLTVNGTNVNPQFWLGNGTEHAVNGQVQLPEDMDVGNWSVFLAITESAPTLQDTLEYNILFVNQPPSAQETGRNDLQRSVFIIDCENSTSFYCMSQQPSVPPVSYNLTVIPGDEGKCPSVDQMETVRADIMQDVHSVLKSWISENEC